MLKFLVMRKHLIIIPLAMVLLLSCSGQQAGTSTNTDGSFCGNTRYAKGFTLSPNDTATIVEVLNSWQGATDVRYTYTLIPRHRCINDATNNHIPVPVERVVCMSASYVAFLDAITSSGAICGLSGVDYIYNPAVRERIMRGEVVEVGYDQTLNYELIASLKPDVLLCYGIGAESMAYYDKLRQLGVRVMVIGEYLENHPLGKAEWIKVFGSLFGREQRADSVFNAVVQNYLKTKELIDSTRAKPKVVLNLPYRDVWYQPGNGSYMVQLIRDAGGSYMFSHLAQSRSYPVSFEKVFEAGLQADVWLNTGAANSLHDIEKIDHRMVQMRPFRDGNVFNNNSRTTQSGGSDFWESGTMNPHIILMDMVSIFHPELMPTYKPLYFNKLK